MTCRGKGVAPDALVRARTETVIHAPLSTIWKLQTDVERRLTPGRWPPSPSRPTCGVVHGVSQGVELPEEFALSDVLAPDVLHSAQEDVEAVGQCAWRWVEDPSHVALVVAEVLLAGPYPRRAAPPDGAHPRTAVAAVRARRSPMTLR